MCNTLDAARKYETSHSLDGSKTSKPLFHVSAPVGWINDPNGFSVFKGKIHLFYQYHPYNTEWGPMHWGHSVTSDMIRWQQLPVALAPDQEYDAFGCFSGSAIEVGDQHVLLYTGVSKTTRNGQVIERQNQCLAYGDGENYVKCDKNPVITGEMLPPNCSRVDFRDPKIWKEDKYYLIVGNKNDQQVGQVILFSSINLKEWKFETILASNDTNKIGSMWECPDFFPLADKRVLICSPQNMKADPLEFHNGNNSVYFIGEYDNVSYRFEKEAPHTLDYGFDFYAPQTTLLPDGRRIMIAWMKSWDVCVMPEGQDWQGMMTIPRELKLKDGRIWQTPICELERYRRNPCRYENELISGWTMLDGVDGRVIDLIVTLEGGNYTSFAMDIAADEEYKTSFSYSREKGILEIDRTFCGVTHDIVCIRKVKILAEELSCMRFVLDRQSIELFINDGQQVVTTAISTPLEAKGIRFFADGELQIRVEKYDIVV